MWKRSKIQAMLWGKLRRICALNFGKSLSVLNDKTSNMLNELWTIAHQLPVANIFSILADPEHSKYWLLFDALHDMAPVLDVVRVDRGYKVALEGWTPTYQNLTGLVFVETFVDRSTLPQDADSICVQARLVDGPGQRVLFKALGAKSVMVYLRPIVPPSWWEQEADHQMKTRLDLERCELQLFNENYDDLQILITALGEAQNSIAQKKTVAAMAGDYLPFKDWAAWDPESREADFPASAKFRELFHQ